MSQSYTSVIVNQRLDAVGNVILHLKQSKLDNEQPLPK
jgi:hypothetical protein